MVTKSVTTQTVPLGRIFLNNENPRHEAVSAEASAIEKLCIKESVLELARDIVRHGTNPLELVGLVPVEQRKTVKGSQTFIVAEGNRRICALKLLSDADLAPANLRKPFEQLAKSWQVSTNVSAVIFSTMKEARLWMERIHNGPQGGIGRKNWNADQKTRFDGDSKNKVALSLLDYAEKLKILKPGERDRKLTTAQRFISNDVFRETLGVDQTDPEALNRTRPKAEFDVILRTFVLDLVEGKQVHSRMNKKEIIDYARTLNGLTGITTNRIEAEPLSTEAPTIRSKKPSAKAPKKPDKVIRVQYHDEINQALRTLGNNKLQSLYHSICTVELENHTPLICIGVWSFFETLTACAGRNDGTSFDSFLSKDRLTKYGITGNFQTLRTAMTRILDYGNTTKHHPVATAFNGDQLNNDMNTLKDVILKCITQSLPKP